MATKVQTPPMKMTRAAIDEELPALQGTFEAPAGFKVSAPAEQRTFSTPASNGTTAKLDWYDQSLSVRPKGGKPVVLIPKDETGFEDLKGWLTDEAKEADQFSNLEWDHSSTVWGVGRAGKMMSVIPSMSEYTGGAHPNSGSHYETFDVRTGKSVTLDEVLSPAQFKSVVDQVSAKLPKLGEMADIFMPVGDGDSPTYEDWANVIKNHFALVTAGDGRRYVRVGWESGIHVVGSVAARFTFAAPTDRAFLEKIGAQ